MSRKRFRQFVSCILCAMLVVSGVIFVGGQTAKAAISPLITSYKPQVVNADVNASYIDSSGNTISAIIHHPGIAMRQTDLDNMRDHVRAGDEPWNTAFNTFSSKPQSSENPRIYYESGYDLFVNIPGPWAFTDANGVYRSNPSDYVGTRANTDSETAFIQAIMWYVTGNETYRSNAMTIIRNYAAIQSVVKHTNFRFATSTYLLAAAAEILRYSDTPTQSLKWSDTDTQNFTNMMELLRNTYDQPEDPNQAHNFFMNQHQFAIMGMIARAIFNNDLQLYAEAVEATTVNSAGNPGGRNGSIKHQMRWMTANEITGEPLAPLDYHVQLMEMGRDAGHTYGNVGGLSTLVKTIDAQGTKVDPMNGTISTASNAVNVFNFLDDRLLAGVTYTLKYHLGHDVLWTPAYSDGYTAGAAYYDKINSDGRGRIDPYLSVLYNYYKYMEQRDMTQEKYKYLAYAYETGMPEVAAKDYPLATLLYTPDAAQTVGLSNQITLGSISGLTATAAGPATINLSWTAVPGALGYNLYRSLTAEGTYTKINSAPFTAASYTNTGLESNMIYYYQVSVAGGSTSAVVSAATGGTGVPVLDASSYTIMRNDTHMTVLTVMDSDRSVEDLTAQASYSSSNPAVATVNAGGVVTGVSLGTATITAAYNGQSYNAAVKVVMDTNLNTWYKFDETSGTTAVDSSGYGNNGTVIGGSNATWTAGKYGNAINFGGTNTTAAYVALPSHIVDRLNSMTFAAWVKSSNTADATSLFTAGPAAAATPTKYMMMLLNGSRFTITANGNTAEQ
ncbi:Ig-like domain-containing protein, partial [Paenibacillus algorifonticola]|uniref:Ig-like domain-containing protein n=1 Tax=Paenibacillus algorifonticola TaxID=684063 RepID=UPI003D279E03